MAGFDLGGSFAAGGAAEALRQLFTQRVQQAALQESIRQHQADEALRQRSIDEQAAWRQLQQQELQRTHQANEAVRQEGAANALGEQLPPGTELMPSSPSVGVLQTGGRGDLLQSRMTLPSTQMTGGATAPEASGSFPETQPAQGALRTTARAEAKPEVFVKQATAKQASDAANADRKDWETSIRQELANLRAGQTPKEPTPHFTAQDRYVNGLPVAGTLNTLTGEWKPSGEGSFHAPPGAAQNARHEADKKEAVGLLEQVDQALDAAKEMVGPGAGRVSNVQMMIGNQDPRINTLGTKLLMAKVKADEAIAGSVRAGASPQLLARWDNILGNQVNYDSLKSALQAMREMLGGGQPATTTVHKKYNPATGSVE